MLKSCDKEQYRLCKIVGDDTDTTFIAVGHDTAYGNFYEWVGKDVVTGTRVIYQCNKSDILDAGYLGLREGKLVIDSSEYITKSEALEKLKELSDSPEKARSYNQAINAVKPRYVAVVKKADEAFRECSARASVYLV